MRRTLRRLAAPLALAALASSAAPSHASQYLTIDGKQYRVEGVSTSPGQDDPINDGVNAYGVAAWVADSLGILPPVRPCVPSSVDITIGDLTGVGLADLTHPGDIYYKWSAPSTVKVKGHCDKETISRVTYVDTPLITLSPFATPSTSQAFEARAKDVPNANPALDVDATVLQAPDWLVLYYSAANLYQRSLLGKLDVIVEASYVDARTGLEVKKIGCKTKTWYFFTNPQQPSYTSQTPVTNC